MPSPADRINSEAKTNELSPNKYVVLFFVIALGVAAGNLISNWVTATIAAYQIERSLEQMTAELQKQDAISKRDQAARAAQDALNAREEKIKQQAKKVQITTCKFWIDEYRRTKSAIDREYRTNACRDAGITVGN